MEDSYFNQFMGWRNQLVIATKNFGEKQSLSPIQILTLFKDMDEQLKLVYWLVDIVGCPERNICGTMLPYNVDKPESLYAQVRLFSRKRKAEKLLETVSVNYILEERKNLLVVLISKYVKNTAKQSVWNVL